MCYYFNLTMSLSFIGRDMMYSPVEKTRMKMNFSKYAVFFSQVAKKFADGLHCRHPLFDTCPLGHYQTTKKRWPKKKKKVLFFLVANFRDFIPSFDYTSAKISLFFVPYSTFQLLAFCISLITFTLTMVNYGF